MSQYVPKTTMLCGWASVSFPCGWLLCVSQQLFDLLRILAVLNQSQRMYSFGGPADGFKYVVYLIGAAHLEARNVSIISHLW